MDTCQSVCHEVCNILSLCVCVCVCEYVWQMHTSLTPFGLNHDSFRPFSVFQRSHKHNRKRYAAMLVEIA
jgi:hypothetical protein